MGTGVKLGWASLWDLGLWVARSSSHAACFSDLSCLASLARLMASTRASQPRTKPGLRLASAAWRLRPTTSDLSRLTSELVVAGGRLRGCVSSEAM